MDRDQILPCILFVNEDRLIRLALNRTFESEHLEVVCASDGREALNILAAELMFNVIMADYFMPHVNGIEFLIHVSQNYPHIYCVMLTAFPYCDAIKHALDKTMNAVLLDKPWDRELLQIIFKVVEEQRVARQVRQA